jgi:hypothetical protein
VLRGQLADILYHGQSARLVVTLGAGQVLVDMPITDVDGSAGLPQVGQTIYISIDPHKIMILKDEVRA